MTKKQKYLNSEAHGYLLESDACALLIKELERACTKFQRRIDKENAARQADFDAAMEYHSENEIQDAYGWELIIEAQYRAYMDLFHRGRQALEEHAPTVSELALSNNGPVKDRLRRGGLVKKQANNTVSGNIRDDAPCNRQ